MAAPEQKRVEEALAQVRDLDGEGIERRIDEELGDPMLASFVLLARNLRPDDDNEARARTVHLMVLAALLAKDAISAL